MSHDLRVQVGLRTRRGVRPKSSVASTALFRPASRTVSMLLLRRPRAALGSRARALCTPASAHLAVLQLYRLQPATVPPGLQPRLLFADGQAISSSLCTQYISCLGC